VALLTADKKSKYESERYERAAKAAMEMQSRFPMTVRILGTPDRELVREGQRFEDARILFRAIQAVSIREDVLNEHPMLRHEFACERDGLT